MASQLPQRCALAFIYVQVVAYLAVAAFLAAAQRFGMMQELAALIATPAAAGANVPALG